MTTEATPTLGSGRFGLCANCPHNALLASQRCEPGDACVRAHSGRQIDRFFRANPEFAPDYLKDGFWERRAIAVRYSPLDRIGPMMHDPDEVVRRTVAMQLTPHDLKAMARDPDREVRITVAQRIDPNDLMAMAGDPDYMVRIVVAR